MTRPKINFKKKIADVKVQGAQNIAQSVLHQMAHLAVGLKPADNKLAWARVYNQSLALASIRPTEPMARNLARWYWRELIKISNKLSSKNVKTVERNLMAAVHRADMMVGRYGASLIKSGNNIFTHCHSSQVERVLRANKLSGKKFSIYHTETRPLFQGRITDRHLRKLHIKTYMVVDSVAPWLISNHSGDDIKIDVVLLGADSIERDGSVINKVGSFGIALAAYESHIPVYIVANLLKFDWDQKSIIEIRPQTEIWPHAPRGIKIINYAFDRVPAKFITGFVTEAGIIKPAQIKTSALRLYPWLKNNAKIKNQNAK